jgi:hypothetical protein
LLRDPLSWCEPFTAMYVMFRFNRIIWFFLLPNSAKHPTDLLGKEKV